MTKKQLFRAVVFALVLLCMFTFLSDVFQNGSNRASTYKTRAYFELEEDTLDVAFLGTSGIDRYWLASKAYEEQGIASFAFATDGYPAWLMLPMVKDFARRHDTLKLVVLDMRAFTATYTGADAERYEVRARTFAEALPFFSLTRLDTISKTLEVISENVEGEDRFDLSYLFTFIKYHSRWSEDDFDPYAETEYKVSPYMGAFIHKKLSIRPSPKKVTTVVTEKRQAIDPVCLEALYELLDYFETQDFEVLFLNTPHEQNARDTRRLNTLCDILDEEGYNYVYCDLDESIYDLQNDFYNPDHVNYYGSEKFSERFISYLKQNYDLPDRRGDERYSQWEGTYDNVKTAIAKLEAAKKAKEEQAAAEQAAAAEKATVPTSAAQAAAVQS
ncbi:MAG: hypothetical protein E7538_09470 [Ruminococcaceae bacterium]|nr:hypothetical protein [Oscillospiraceae bacterium]